MTYKKTVDYLYSLGFFGIKTGLKNITALCKHLNNPQNSFKAIHVAGTNGKGSTCSIVNSILSESGINCGLYTSPHLVDFRERIRVNGIPITKKFVTDFIEENRKKIDELKATYFEVTTAMSFAYFLHCKVDIAVIETGMGGRLDSTNILKPVLTVITPISIDHQKYLGNTIESVAREKGGILKPKIPVVLSPMDKVPAKIIKSIAVKNKSSVVVAKQSKFADNIKISIRGTSFSVLLGERVYKIKLPLIGRHQIQNTITAITAILQFNSLGYNISDKSIIDGIKKLVWPGRFMPVETNPTTILDVSHNVHGAKVMTETFKECFNGKKPLFVIGMMKDKDIKLFFKALKRLNGRYILTCPKTQRSASLTELEKFSGIKDAKKIEQVSKAVEFAKKNAKKNEIIIVTGSFYTVSEAIKSLGISIN